MSIFDSFNSKEKQIKELQVTISDLEKQNISLREQVKNLNSRTSDLISELSNLEQERNELRSKTATLESFIHERIPYFNINTIINPITQEERCNLWNTTWQNIDHNDSSQILKQRRATRMHYTPLKIDYKTSSAIFRDYQEDFTTSLINCDCMSFQQSLCPCRHMYRLAHELKVFPLDNVESISEPQKIIYRDRLESIISTLSSAQIDILHDIASHGIETVRRTAAIPLLELELVEICTDKFALVNSYAKNELWALLSDDNNLKKNSKKIDLINYILSSRLDIIEEMEKLRVPIRFTPYVLHLKKYI